MWSSSRCIRDAVVPPSNVASTVACAAVYALLDGLVAGFCWRECLIWSKKTLLVASKDGSSADDDKKRRATPRMEPNKTTKEGDEEIKNLRTKIDALRKEKKSLETKVSALQEEVAERRKENESMESLQKRLDEKEEHLKSESLKKASLEKALSDTHKIINDKESSEETMKYAMASLSTEKEQLESNLRRSVTANQEMEQTIRTLKQGQEQSKARVQKLRDSLGSADTKRKEQEIEFAKLNDEKKALDALLRETKELNSINISTLEQLCADQEKESQELKDCLEKSKTEIQNLQKSLNNMSSKLREQEDKFTKVNDEKKALDAKLNEKKEVEEKKVKIPDVLLKSKYGEQIKLAVELARKAGANKQELGGFWLGLDTNTNKTVDVMNEKIIIDGIKKSFPNDEIIGEESSEHTTIIKSDGFAKRLYPRKRYWVINPLDGSTNFSTGLHSLTCVSISYCIGGRPVVGVVYAPGLGELFVAVENKGAFCNGERIFQDPKLSVKKVEKAVICNEMGKDIDGVIGKSVDKDTMDELLIAQTRLKWKGCRSMRQLGSGCLDLCFVASGRLDVVYSGLGSSQRWGPWDYAAGLVICKEAGCTMESIEEQKNPGCDGFDLYSSTMICGVSNELVSDLRNTLKKSKA